MASRKPIVVSETFFNIDSAISVDQLANIKLMLMSPNPASQIAAVSWISKNLITASDADCEILIDRMMSSDVLTYFCKKIGCSYGHLFTSMLDILERLIINSNFYKKNFAKMAVESMLRVAFLMTKKLEAHEETLALVAYTLHAVLDGASTAQVSLDRVCYLTDVVVFLKNLKSRLSSKYVTRLGAARVLCLVMENIEFEIDDETKLSLLESFKDSLLAIGDIVEENKDSQDPEIFQNSMELLCSICSLGSRFCKDVAGEDYAKAITSILIETIIPQLKAKNLESNAFEATVTYFVECLDQIFQFRNGDRELAEMLAKNGFLKNLLLIPFPSLRKSVDSLVSRIIASLSEDDFSSDQSEDLAKFRRWIHEGIAALPSNKSYILDTGAMLSNNGVASDAFLILLYHHCLKTDAYDSVTLPSIILKAMTLSDTQDITVLKATWFLFAISSLKHSATDSVLCYNEAAKNLAALLEIHDLRRCYTHNSGLLQHSLSCERFPPKLQFAIVRLWLDFDGEVEPLLSNEYSELMVECLVSTVKTGSEKLVNRALEVIAELKCDEQRCARIGEQVWRRLPSALTSWTEETVANVKGLLKLSEGRKPEGQSLEIYRKAASTLIKALASKEFDDELKIQLLRYVYTLLEVSFTRDSPAVVESCVSEAHLMELLRDTGFTEENYQLSAFCINLLAYIVELQRQLQVSCAESKVVTLKPLRLLVLLARSNIDLHRGAMRLLVELLDGEGETIFAVTLGDFESIEAADEAIYAWYRILHQRFPKVLQKDWRLVYRCMIAMLVLCVRKQFSQILRRLCAYPMTYDVLRWTMDHKYADSIFFEFAEVWIRYGRKYRSMNVDRVIHSRWFGNRGTGDSEFDEIIKLLSQYHKEHEKNLSTS